MSNRYKGGVISATPPTTTGGESGTASGAWTLEQQMQLQAAGLWPSQPPPSYIEDVFSTYLYTGTGAAQTITNGIDLSTKGGLVWFKDRTNAYSNGVFDSARGITKLLVTNTTAANVTTSDTVTSFNTTGFSIGIDSGWGGANGNVSDNYVSWTFRKQAKFFDVQTFTAPSSGVATINHNLGSVPGCIVLKILDGTGSWFVYHRSLSDPLNETLALNTTGAVVSQPGYWTSVGSTSVQLTVGTALTAGFSYVMYLWAHDAGGFGTLGTDNVISCGSFTAGTGSINLGYEPQWIMFKGLTGANEWIMFDTMRGWPTEVPNKLLMAQSTAAEGDTYVNCQPTATGFNYSFSPSCIYIAIRRGPMKVPTDATKVFTPALGRASPNPNYVSGFPVDLGISEYRVNGSNSTGSRLQGSNIMDTASTGAEASDGSTIWDFMDGYYTGGRSTSFVSWMFRRAPGFFDEVCYTGTGSATTVTHNLTVAPEMMIVKGRSNSVNNWAAYHVSLGNTKTLFPNLTLAATTVSYWNNTTPTSSVFSLGTSATTNGSGTTFVAYLFATCAGVSKVGSYTGTATTLQVDCGFTAGSRFVLIKRTDSTGDWYVWDSARGIVAGNDPYLLLNDTAAEVTGTDYVDTYAAGFEVTSTAPAAINANGGTFIFLAIA